MNPIPVANPYALFYSQKHLFSHCLKKKKNTLKSLPSLQKISLNCTFLALSLVESVTYTHFCFLISWTLLKLQEFNFPMSLSATFLSLNPEWSSSAQAHTHLILHLSGTDAINHSFSFLFKTQSLL